MAELLCVSVRDFADDLAVGPRWGWVAMTLVLVAQLALPLAAVVCYVCER